MSVYLMEIDKLAIEKIKDMTNEQLKNCYLNTKERDYLTIFDLPMTNIFHTYHYFDLFGEVEKLGVPLFTKGETTESIDEYRTWVICEKGLLKMIEICQKIISSNYDHLLNEGKEEQKNYFIRKLRCWIKDEVLNLNRECEYLTDFQELEFLIFELVRILKTFDFRNKRIVFCSS